LLFDGHFVMVEIWKDIPNYVGAYQVSNLGNVKSLSRPIIQRYIQYISKEKLLTPKVNSGGYLWVKLYGTGKKSFAVHVLVALAFLGERDSLNVVNHKDGNKLNNHIDNLEYCSQRENIHHHKKSVKSTSKYIGVCYDTNTKKWCSKIKVKGKTVNLGRFENEIDAYHKYLEYAQSQGLPSKYS